MNILYITPNFTIGGTESQIFSLAVNLNKRKFTPYVISIGIDYGQREQYYRNNIEARTFKISDLVAIAAYIKRRKIDIVHSFYYGNFSGWELLSAKLAGVKIFITSRRNMGYWRRGRHIIFDLFRNSFTDIIVANSYAVREKMISDERVSPSRVVVIYNGIDFFRYAAVSDGDAAASRKKLGIDPDCRVVGMVSNIKSIKGYEYFLGAARMISQKRRDVKFVVAGEGSDEPDFRKTVCEYGLDGSLIALGLRDDLSAVFSVIDIFMYSSLSEGFPNVILEAMASRKPIVATDVGGTCEMLKNGYSGILVPPRSSQELAGATMALLDDGARARRLAEAARTAAKELFGIEEWLKQYEFVYENMYEKSKHNGGLS